MLVAEPVAAAAAVEPVLESASVQPVQLVRLLTAAVSSSAERKPLLEPV